MSIFASWTREEPRCFKERAVKMSRVKKTEAVINDSGRKIWLTKIRMRLIRQARTWGYSGDSEGKWMVLTKRERVL